MARIPVRQRLLHPFVIMPALALIAVAVWWFGIRTDESSAASNVSTSTDQVVQVTRGPMVSTVSAEGTVAAADTDELSFGVSGTVTAVNVKAGDTVTAGQVLATVDSAELAAAVTNVESTVADSKAKLADDQTASVSSDQIAADIASVATANDALTTAYTNLAGAQLVATIDGTVASVDVTVGEKLSSSGTGGTGQTGSASGTGRSSSDLGSGSGSGNGSGSGTGNGSSGTSTAQIEVVSTGRYKVDVSVDSADIANVAVGQTATLTVTTSSAGRNGRFGGFRGAGGGGFTFGGGGTGGNNGNATATNSGATATGTVTDVSKVATASSGVATYTVTVSFTDPSNQIFVGSTVTADVVTKERTNITQVPSRAVTTDQNGSTVRVALDGTTTGRVETRDVTVGATVGGETEIQSGVKAGDRVIISLPAFFGTRNGTGATGTGTNGGTRTGTGTGNRTFGGNGVTGNAGANP